MDKYFSAKSHIVENDIVTYESVLMVASVTPKGPLRGEKFDRAIHYTVLHVVVFENKNRLVHMIGFDRDGVPSILC